MFSKSHKIAHAFGGDFNGYEPLKLHREETRGDQSYKGDPLKYIKAGRGLKISTPMLEERLKRLIESSWLHAKPTEGATRGSVMAGNHRVAHPSMANQFAAPLGPGGGMGGAPAMPPLPLRPGQRPAVPMVDQYRNVAPISYSDRIAGQNPAKIAHLLTTVPQDWNVMKSLPLVSAFTFRGDTRNPQQIAQANGFQAPITRTDTHYLTTCVYPTFNAYLRAKLNISLTVAQFMALVKKTMPNPDERLIFSFYEMWRGQVAAESMHAGRMVAKEDLKGFVSTTKATTVAKGFAKANGYVYVTLVRTGFHIPSQGAHDWTQLFGEEEIASPYAIPWSDIFGFRKVGPTPYFEGPVYLRSGFEKLDSSAFEKCYRALSGKHSI